jgi:endoglucanase
MLSSAAVTFLKRLLDSPGPSGFESIPAKAWREEASGFAEVSGDALGNSFAVVNPTGSPTILLAGHIDEIGIMVVHIDDDGFASIAGIGGWDPQVLVAQRVRILGRNGEVMGVVGKKPIHVIKVEDRDKGSKMTDLWVDIGAANRAEAEARIAVGDPGVLDQRTLDFPHDRIVSRSIDDRIGAFVVLEAARRYAAKPGAAKVVAVATVQEEIGFSGGGARVAADRVDPQMAIVVDVTFATDHPNIEKKEHGDHKLGSGPVFSRGSIFNPVALKLLTTAAADLQIPHTMSGAPRGSMTDADAIQVARSGVATALVSIPNRYMHSPNEMVSLTDLDRAADVIAEACRRVGAGTDFTNR